MKEMTWDEYYERFFNLSASTQKSYSYRLSNFGPAEEVYDILHEFIWNDKKFAATFLTKALGAGVRFTPEHVIDLIGFFDGPLISRMAENTSIPFTREELEDVYSLIDEDTFNRISRKQHIDIFSDDGDEEPIEEDESTEYMDEEPQPKGPGFFATLFAALAAIGSIGGHKKKDTGRCDGDCANCPAHYGYRYGRWYYGHGHQHGCERGGNGGASGKTYRD